MQTAKTRPAFQQPAFQMIPPSQIALGPNVRRTVNPQELAELAQSIAGLRDLKEGIEESGLLQALLVRPLEPFGSVEASSSQRGFYQLICGQKRLLAARDLDFSSAENRR